MPRVMVFFAIASQYAFWPSVLGLMGLPLAVMQTTSPASSFIFVSFPSETSLRI